MVFPLTTRVNDQNHLEIGGCDLIALAREFGTPLYVFDEAHLEARAAEVRDGLHRRLAKPSGPFRQTLSLYATKAYFSPYLARLYKREGLGIEVTSEGELEIARRVDFPRERIYLHGNNKTESEIRTALTLGAEHIIVDNLDEIDLLARVAAEWQVVPRILLRLAPAIDPHTHKFLATGVADSKFGLSIATGDAFEAARRVAALAPGLRFVGLHLHIGSQIFELEPYQAALGAALDLAEELRRALSLELEELDLGGGWGVAYTDAQESLPIDTLAATLLSALTSRHSDFESRLSNVTLLFEPGRTLVAGAAVALYTVGAIKRIPGGRTYVSVDGGMGDNIRPALYGARYTARVANRANNAPTRRVAIAGRYCEQGDILIEDAALPEIAIGDCIAIPVAGAYQLPMASNYNLIPRPAVVLVREGKARVIRRRETIDDLLILESDE
jgi:diaminopimelate decarboxylase